MQALYGLLEALDGIFSSTRLRRSRGLVRPGAAGFLTDIECSRVRDSAWDVPYYIVTTRTEVGLVE